jgi:hypothetical protein
MAVKEKAGVWFQDLTAIIEKVFVGDAFTSVESPAYLPELTSGARREFDVLITRTQEHHTTRTAIECKDTASKVDVQTVEGFAPKSRGCGVHRAIIVSRTGFTTGALRKAAELGIDCMTLSSANVDDVRVRMEIRHRQVTFVGVSYGVPSMEQMVHPFQAYAASGEPVTPKGLSVLASRAAPEPDAIELATGTRNYEIVIDGSASLYLIDANGERFEPTLISLAITCTNAPTPPLDYYTYEGAGKRYAISIARDVTAGTTSGNLVFVNDEAGLRAGFVAALAAP